MKTKVALLDLGGVVFNSTGRSNEKIDWSIISKLNYKFGHQLNIGEDIFGDFMEAYNVHTQQNLTGSEFLKLVFDTLEFNEELIKFLSKDHRIFIVSDNYRENITYISQRYHFSSWAEKQFYSFDFKMVKSNPAFFKLLLDEINIPVTDLVFIDDSIKKLESAAGHGIRGILFKNNEELKSNFANQKN